MAMARDGLLPAFFAEINPRTHVPVKNTIVIGVLAASLAFFMDVSQLSEMVNLSLPLLQVEVSLISKVLIFELKLTSIMIKILLFVTHTDIHSSG